jgi:hypothetical protein
MSIELPKAFEELYKLSYAVAVIVKTADGGFFVVTKEGEDEVDTLSISAHNRLSPDSAEEETFVELAWQLLEYFGPITSDHRPYNVNIKVEKTPPIDNGEEE